MINKKIINLKMEGLMKHSILILLCILSFSFSQIPSRGLISFFPFNGSSKTQCNKDVCNNITKIVTYEPDYYLPNPDTSRFGEPNSAISLLDNNIPGFGLIFEDTANILPFKNKEFTVCIWICEPSYGRSGTSPYPIIVYGDSILDKKEGFRIYREKSNIYVSYNNKTNIIKSVSLYSDKWYFIAITVSNNTLRSYIRENNTNEIEKFEYNDFSIPSNVPNIFSIGALARTDEYKIKISRSYIGKIDDVCIYNRTLTENEITNIYNSTKATINKAPIFTPTKLDTSIKTLENLYYTINIQNDDNNDIKYFLNPTNNFTINRYCNL
jgi:hypothetical protein